MTVNSVDLSPVAAVAPRLLVLGLGAGQALSRRAPGLVRSLHQCDHVSADDLVAQEIAGRTPWGTAAERARSAGRPVSDETMLALLRRWFFSRKSHRGFVLAGFPASLAQALVFDQWLDERDESLTACLWLDESGTSTAASVAGESHVAAHYHERGLLFVPPLAHAATDATIALRELIHPLFAGR